MVCESYSTIAVSFILIGYYAVKIKRLVYTKTVINSAYGREKKTSFFTLYTTICKYIDLPGSPWPETCHTMHGLN